MNKNCKKITYYKIRQKTTKTCGSKEKTTKNIENY